MENGFSVSISRFQIRFILTHEMLSPEPMNFASSVAIAKETCRVINMGTQILTTEVIPAHEADMFGDRFGELMESCDGL